MKYNRIAQSNWYRDEQDEQHFTRTKAFQFYDLPGEEFFISKVGGKFKAFDAITGCSVVPARLGYNTRLSAMDAAHKYIKENICNGANLQDLRDYYVRQHGTSHAFEIVAE